MAILTDSFDLGGLRMGSGEGRRMELAVGLARFELGGESYSVTPSAVPVTLEISRTTQSGYALRLRFEAGLGGPCMRCLTEATQRYVVDAWEISQPASGEELESPYLLDGALQLRGWARDALALVLPTQILCRPDCPGLCPGCGVRLDEAGAGHGHQPAADPRWAKLSELHFDA